MAGIFCSKTTSVLLPRQMGAAGSYPAQCHLGKHFNRKLVDQGRIAVGGKYPVSKKEAERQAKRARALAKADEAEKQQAAHVAQKQAEEAAKKEAEIAAQKAAVEAAEKSSRAGRCCGRSGGGCCGRSGG